MIRCFGLTVKTNLIIKENQMNEFKTQWKQLASKKALTRHDMAILALLKASRKDKPFEEASKYLLASLRPISNIKKIGCGARPYLAMWDGVRYCIIKANEVLLKKLSEEELSKIKILSDNIAGGYYAQVKLYGQ
jgi:hypothetical protein